MLLARPKDVILLSCHHLITCKCPYSQNVEHLVASLNKKISVLNMTVDDKRELKLYTVYDVLNVVMCSKNSGEKFNHVKCINSDCETCNDTAKRIKVHYKPLLHLELGMVKYKSW